MVEDCSRRGADMAGAGPNQLLVAAVSVKHTDRAHSIILRPDHVVAAVADHQRLRRVHAGCFERIGQQVGLVDARAVQFRTEHALEVIPQAEVIDDPLGEDVRLAGCDEHAAARVVKRRQDVLDAGIEAVLVEADIANRSR